MSSVGPYSVYHDCCQSSVKTQKRQHLSVSNISWFLAVSSQMNVMNLCKNTNSFRRWVYSSMYGQRNDSSQANKAYTQSPNYSSLGTTIANMVQYDLNVNMYICRYIYIYIIIHIYIYYIIIYYIIYWNHQKAGQSITQQRLLKTMTSSWPRRITSLISLTLLCHPTDGN